MQGAAGDGYRPPMMRVGWVQTNPVFGDVARNVRAVEAAVAGQQAELWVLPELFSTGYLFGSRTELERLAEPIPEGPTTNALIELAARTGSAIIAGIAERTAPGGLYNTAIAVDSDGLRAVYRKIHLFDHEKEWFDPGDLGFPVVSLAGARVGLMICFDWRYPEAARTLALCGAQILAHPANLVQPHCQGAMITRALENLVFTVTANRVGTEERLGITISFTGQSRIVAPDGTVLSNGPAGTPATGIVAIDPGRADDKWATPRNHLLSDRRPAFYRLDAG